jgi:hypothetical protein
VITSPLRPRTQRQESGIAAGGRLAHPRNALRRFTFVRHHDASTASFRPALTETPQRMTKPHWDRPVNSGPRPCLFDVGFPLSGLQDRTSTPDLNVRARHTSGRPPGDLRSHRVANPDTNPLPTHSTTGSLAEPPYHPHIQHASIKSTEIYLHADNKLKQQAIERAAPTGTPPGR